MQQTTKAMKDFLTNMNGAVPTALSVEEQTKTMTRLLEVMEEKEREHPVKIHESVVFHQKLPIVQKPYIAPGAVSYSDDELAQRRLWDAEARERILARKAELDAMPVSPPPIVSHFKCPPPEPIVEEVEDVYEAPLITIKPMKIKKNKVKKVVRVQNIAEQVRKQLKALYASYPRPPSDDE